MDLRNYIYLLLEIPPLTRWLLYLVASIKACNSSSCCVVYMYNFPTPIFTVSSSVDI